MAAAAADQINGRRRTIVVVQMDSGDAFVRIWRSKFQHSHIGMYNQLGAGSYRCFVTFWQHTELQTTEVARWH